MLNEQDRAKLDGIVQQMTANKEPDTNVQMVVNDFKQKYSKAPANPAPTPTPVPETGIVQDLAQSVAKPFLGMASQARDIGTSIGDIATGVKDAVQGNPVVVPQRPSQTEYDYGYLGKVKSLGNATFDKEGMKSIERAAGAGAGMASNIAVGGPLKTLGKSILERTIPRGIQLLKEGALPGALALGGNSAQEGENPLMVAGKTLAGAAIGSVGNLVVGGTLPAIIKPLTTTFDKLTKPLQTHMSDVAQNINRALSTQGKKSIGVFLNNPKKQYKAFEIMHDMAPSLKVVDPAGDVVPWNPKETNFEQFAQAFKDAKDQTWAGISKSVQEATGKDLHVDAGPILDTLNKTASNKFTTSEVRAAAARLSDEVANMTTPGSYGQIPIAGLTEYNKVLNTKISGVLAGTTDNAVRDLEAGLAKQLSEAADTAVGGITDSRFATLKDNYGALKTIERDLVRRAQQESRQIDNSLGDFMSRYGTIEMANGLFQAAHGNLGPLVKGVGAKVLGAYSKKLRTPSTYLKKAFSEIDRYKSGEGVQNAAVRGVEAVKNMSKKNPKGMIDFNAEMFPKKKVELPTNNTKKDYLFEDTFGGSVAANIKGSEASIYDAFAKEKGHALYENAIKDLTNNGIKTITVSLQSKDSTEVLKKLLEKGILKNPRNSDLAVKNGYPRTFDIVKDKYTRDTPTGKFSTGGEKKYLADSVKEIPEEDLANVTEVEKIFAKPSAGDTKNILLEDYIPLFKKYGLPIKKMGNEYHGEIKNLIQEITNKSKKINLDKQSVKKAIAEDTAGIDIMKERMGMFPKKK